jgi:hypothetical protein
MTFREAIDQTRDKLIEDRELMSILNRTKTVRIPVLLPLTSAPIRLVPDNTVVPVVIFTIEETVLGRRLMAEFEGRKEFVA